MSQSSLWVTHPDPLFHLVFASVVAPGTFSCCRYCTVVFAKLVWRTSTGMHSIQAHSLHFQWFKCIDCHAIMGIGLLRWKFSVDNWPSLLSPFVFLMSLYTLRWYFPILLVKSLDPCKWKDVLYQIYQRGIKGSSGDLESKQCSRKVNLSTSTFSTPSASSSDELSLPFHSPRWSHWGCLSPVAVFCIWGVSDSFPIGVRLCRFYIPCLLHI